MKENFKKTIQIILCCSYIFFLTACENNLVENKSGDTEEKTNETSGKSEEKEDAIEDSNKENTEAIKYTITFDSAGGSRLDNQTIEKDNKVSKPKDPTKKDYIFVEWQLDGKKFDFNSNVLKNITLKAIWKKNEINNYNSGNNSSGNNNNSNNANKEEFKLNKLIFTVQSNNIQNYAKDGATVTLQVISNKKIQDLNVKFSNGKEADSIEKIDDTNCVIYYYVRDSDPDGYLTFELDVKDTNGIIHTYTDLDANQRVIINKTIPTISSWRAYSNNANPRLATTGDLITIEIVGNEKLQQVFIRYGTGTGLVPSEYAKTNDDYIFTVKFIVAENISIDGYPLDFEVRYKDLASNEGQTLYTFLLVNNDPSKMVTLYK